MPNKRARQNQLAQIAALELASLEKAEAEKRLREAEARLKKAIQELNDSHENRDWNKYPFSSKHPLCQHCDSCTFNSVGGLCQSFLLAYGVRVGIGVLLRAFKLAKSKSYRSILDLKLLVSEKDLIVREEACRIGLLFGGFTGCYHGMRCILRRLTNKERAYNEIIAGSVAGLSVLALDDPNRRRTFALYLLARLAQCLYNSAKSKNKFHFWGSQWRHGDSLLFALASAQVMYAYVMRPETLPESYLEFIVKTGPISKPVLKAVRDSCRKEPIDIPALSAFVLGKNGGRPLNFDPNCQLVPCSIIHPHNIFCSKQITNATRATFKKTFPLYMALTFVPFVVLNIQKFMHSPLRTFLTAFRGAVRSTCFISTFVGIYQSYICLHRRIAVKDHKLVYWFGGAIAALSVLLEKKGRRAELALYVLPRAADSLWYILVNRHLLPNIRHAEVALFCLCMGGIMYFHENEPDTMAPFLRGLIKRFLNRGNSSDLQPSNSNNSLNLLGESQSINEEASNKQLGENPPSRETEIIEKLSAEAFQGL